MTHVYGYRLFCVCVDCNCKRAMASGITRCAIASVLDDMKPKYRSSRIEKAQELGKTIMEQAGETEMTAFEGFSTELLELLRGLLQSSTTYRSSAAKREKLWSSFHQACLLQLPELWEKFLSSLSVVYDDDLLQQSVSLKVFEMLLTSEFSTSSSHPRTSLRAEELQVSKDHSGMRVGTSPVLC